MKRYSEVKNRFLIVGLAAIVLLAVLISITSYLVNNYLTAQFIEKYLETESMQLVNLRIEVENTLFTLKTSNELNLEKEHEKDELLKGLSDHVKKRQAIYAIVLSPNGEIVEYTNPKNQKELPNLQNLKPEIGQPADDLVNKPSINSFYHSESFQKFYEIRIPIHNNAQGTNGEIKVYMSHKDIINRLEPVLGHIHNIFYSASLIGGGIFLIIGLIVFFLLNSTRNLQHKIEEEKHLTAVGTIASGMAHEIKNPLNALSMNIQMIQMKMQDGSQRDNEYIDSKLSKAMDETKRLEGILNSFLQLKKEDEPFQKVNLFTLLSDCVDLLKVESDYKKLYLDMQVEKSLCTFGPLNKLKQVFINLLLNSIQHTDSGGVLVKGIREIIFNEEKILLEIIDTGKGVPIEQQGKIFDLFFTTRANGTGMGLHVAKSIVSEMHGDIKLTKSDSRGSTFQLILPFYKDENGDS